MCFFMLFKCIVYAHPSVDWGQTKSCFGKPRSDVFCGTAGTVMGVLVFLAGFWSEEHKPDECAATTNSPRRWCSPLLNAIWLWSAQQTWIAFVVMLMPLIKTGETIQ